MGPAFPESEHRKRLARVRHALVDADLAGLICVAPEHLYYLAGHDAYTFQSEQALILSAESDEPTFVMRDVDKPLADETSWVTDIRTYHFDALDPTELIREAVEEKGLWGEKIGADLKSFAFPTAYGLRLLRALGPSKVEGATELVGRLRWVKSPLELKYVREAASYSRAGLEAALASTRPGITETQLAAEIEYAMRSMGCDYPAIPSFVASGSRTACGHAMPTDKQIEMGDVVHVEFAGVARRYHCVAMTNLCIGEPSARALEIFQVSRDSLLAGMDAIRVGGTFSEAEVASLKPLEERNLAQHAMMRFGVGNSASYPPSWADGLDIISESDEVFESGMTFYLHAVLEIPEDDLGFVVGGSFHLTGEGLDQMDSDEFELNVVTS